MISEIKHRTQFSSLGLCCLLLVLAPVGAVAEITIYTVGTCGTYDDIQDAIDALVVGATTEIRIQGNATYEENLLFSKFFNAGRIEMTGGWDCLFTTRDNDPSTTVIDGGAENAVARVRVGGGELLLRDFSVTNGEAEKGAGLQILLDGGARVELENLRVVGNKSISSGSVHGGGVSADIDGTEVLEIRGLLAQQNLVISSNQAVAYGAGLSIMAGGEARFTVEDSQFNGNRIENPGGDDALGGGVYLETIHHAQGRLSDSRIFENTAIGDVTVASGLGVESAQSADIVVERTGVMLNSAVGASGGSQLRARAQDASSITVRDSGVVQADSEGVYAYVVDSGDIYLTNLTVADHTAIGVRLGIYELGGISLYNTISFGNLENLQAPAKLDDGANLIGVDPLFTDPASLDYHLQPGTPAEDAGDNDPPGGLGAADFDGTPRIVNGTVDIGMYEGISVIFGDGFESADFRFWSAKVP
jgi:hypothetical protein